MPNDDGSGTPRPRSDDPTADDDPSHEPLPRRSPSPAPPVGEAGESPTADRHAMGKLLVKRALFPGRVQPLGIGRYTVLRALGQGSMGVVYVCYDEQLDRRVAIKVLRSGNLRDRDTSRTRLLREAQALARLNHSNIVSVYEVGEDGPVVYLVMEFVRGVGLDRWIEREHPWAEILATFIQAGRGLAAAHRAGIVHRDFKPHNAMINEDGVVKVLDFGLARTSDDSLQETLQSANSDRPAQSSSNRLTALTRTGALLGTPAYMSPEQHRGELATAASDQFSFCVALHEALYGASPFSVTSLAELQRDVLSGRIAPAPQRSPVPARVQQALRRGMAVEPDRRFASMDDLLTALAPGAPLRRTMIVATTAALLCGAGLAFAATRDSVEQCPDAQAELSGIWDPERIEVVRTSLRATPHADTTLPRIERDLTRYANEWVHMRNDACLAHAEGRQSARLFDLRSACLDRRRASLRAVTETLVAPSPESQDHLIEAVVGLPPLELCADAAALTAEVAPPEDPTLRARVNRHFEDLAQANIYMNTSQFRRARDIVDGVLNDPEVRTYEPVLAQAYVYKSYLQEYEGEMATVLDSLDRALSAALGGGHDILAAQASAGRMFYLAAKLERMAEAKADMWLVTALNRRAQRDVDTFARYLHFMGVVHLDDGDVESGLGRLQEAVTFRERHGRERTREHLGTLMVLGTHTEALGRHTEAAELLRRAIERSEEILGPYYTSWYWSECYLAYSTIHLGRPREALGRLQRNLDARADGIVSDTGEMSYQSCLARAELVLGDPVAAYRRLGDTLRRRPPKAAEHLFWAELMWIAATAGDAEGMQRAADEALRGLDGYTHHRGLQYQETLLRHGQALAALSRPEEALVPWTTAHAALSGSQSPLDIVRRAALSLEMGKARSSLATFDAAERDLRSALSEFEQVLPPQSLELAHTRLALGELALARQRPAEAAEWLLAAESIFAASAEPDYPPLVRTRAMLAQNRVDGGESR